MIQLPMLAISSTGASGRPAMDLDRLIARGYLLDTKLDGVRSFAKYGRLINREGVDITHRYPELDIPSDHWFDGEIVALDGSFETALLRDQQSSPAKIKRLSESKPCRYVAFDLLDRMEETYIERRSRLEDVQDANPDLILTPISSDRSLFDLTRDLGMEGVIAKRPGSRYRFGKKSPDWVKFKHLHRVTCIVVDYTEGTGARKHFGAMELLMLRDEQPVSVGRVGSGFTERDIPDLKARLDRNETLVIEVECTARTSGGQLRFPVYRGIRSDVPLNACSADQIDTLPAC